MIAAGLVHGGGVTLSSSGSALLRTGALATALAVGGGRPGRRAAARGALCAGVAVATARSVVRAVGVRSEDIAQMPGPRTMSTWALAAGAAMEMPRAGVPLGALALGLSGAEARAQRRVASPLAGAIVGIGASMVTRVWWPLAPLSARSVRRMHRREHVAPSSEGAGLVVVVNRAAGSRRSPTVTPVLCAALPEATITESGLGEDLSRLLIAVTEDAEAVGVAGGDGTLNAGAAVAMDRDLPLAAIPTGTLNHFARDLGVASADDVISAVRRGQVVPVDVGLMNGRPFLNQANIGGYADLIEIRERLEHRIGKWPAAAFALVVVLWRSQRVRVEIDGEEHRIWMAFIGNCQYAPSGIVPSIRDRLDDGVLDVRLITADRSWSRSRLLLAALAGRVERSPVFDRRLAREMLIRVRDPGTVRTGVDGESFDGPVDIVVRKRDRPLLVYVPHN